MKKVIGFSTLAILAVLVFGFAGLAYAQGPTPTQPVPGQGQAATALGQARGGGFAGRGGMRAGLQTAGTAPWHEAVIATLAEAFGTTPEALQARLDAGETLWQVAESLGWSGEQLQAEMLAARSAALQQAVADGLLTQEQADFMAQRMSQGWPEGYGPGSAGCDGSGQGAQPLGRQGRRGQGMRWNSQVAP